MANDSSTGTETANRVTDQVGHIGQQVKEIGGQVSQAAHEFYDQGKARAEQYRGDLEGFVRDQPVKSLLIAAGAGLLLGILFKRR